MLCGIFTCKINHQNHNMKKPIQIIIALLVVGGIMGVAYHLSNRTPSSELSLDAQALEIMTDGGCLLCHSTGQQLPFYANFPIAKGMITQDIELGLKHADLTDMFEAMKTGASVSEVDLAKVEYVVKAETMPPFRFSAMHWGSAITSDKADILEDWIAQQRTENYATGIAALHFANEMVQPLVDSIATDPAKVALGNKLFHDVRFSSDNTISCASCHGLNTGGVDNEPFSPGVDGQLGGVNAPTVYNAVFNKVQFWDGRAENLAAQAAGPPLNPVEMASVSWDQIIGKLKDDKDFTAEFTAVYPEGYSEQTLTDAIAEFEKTLITPNSPFDRYLKGDAEAMTAQEQHGYELFKDYKCATCHVGVNMGGQSYELMGLKDDYFAQRGTPITDGDMGRFSQTQIERDRHRFKTPTLRNIALTAPYMHDASAKTLEEAVDIMVRYQTATPLSATDRADMVAFLNALTGEFNGKPLTNNKQ